MDILFERVAHYSRVLSLNLHEPTPYSLEARDGDGSFITSDDGLVELHCHQIDDGIGRGGWRADAMTIRGEAVAWTTFSSEDEAAKQFLADHLKLRLELASSEMTDRESEDYYLARYGREDLADGKRPWMATKETQDAYFEGRLKSIGTSFGKEVTS